MSDDYYFIINKQLSYVIDAQGQGTGDGTPLIIYHQKSRSQGDDNQLWQLVASSTTDYYFLEGKQSQKVIDVQQGRTGAESPLIIYHQKSSNTDNQLWQLVPSGGYYYIQGKQSQKVLDSQNESTSDGTLAVIDAQNSADTQLWQFIKRLEITGSAFSPDPVEIAAGFMLDLQWIGAESPITVYTSTEAGVAYALFGGDTNAYSVSNEGTAYTVRSDAPPAMYYIEYIPPKKREPVRGTINVKRAIKAPR